MTQPMCNSPSSIHGTALVKSPHSRPDSCRKLCLYAIPSSVTASRSIRHRNVSAARFRSPAVACSTKPESELHRISYITHYGRQVDLDHFLGKWSTNAVAVRSIDCAERLG